MIDYKFSGKIEIGREVQPFDKELKAESEKHAKDKLYAELGSKHSVQRKQHRNRKIRRGSLKWNNNR